jgi:hypothetical protein
MAGLAATSAPLVYPLDADDPALRGVLARMADTLERNPEAAACVGDILEFGEHRVLRKTPARLDPYRVAYTNEYPITALFRRSVLEAVGAWRSPSSRQGYEDWNLWMGLAERGHCIVHLGGTGYCRRLHGRRLNHEARRRHADLYRAMRRHHTDLFARLPEHSRTTDLSALKKRLYPLVHGARAEVPFERLLKPLFDRTGIWTRAQPGWRRRTRLFRFLAAI